MDPQSLSSQIKCGTISQPEACNIDIPSLLTVCVYDSVNLRFFYFPCILFLRSFVFVEQVLTSSPKLIEKIIYYKQPRYCVLPDIIYYVNTKAI